MSARCAQHLFPLLQRGPTRPERGHHPPHRAMTNRILTSPPAERKSAYHATSAALHRRSAEDLGTTGARASFRRRVYRPEPAAGGTVPRWVSCEPCGHVRHGPVLLTDGGGRHAASLRVARRSPPEPPKKEPRLLVKLDAPCGGQLQFLPIAALGKALLFLCTETSHSPEPAHLRDTRRGLVLLYSPAARLRTRKQFTLLAPAADALAPLGQAFFFTCTSGRESLSPGEFKHAQRRFNTWLVRNIPGYTAYGVYEYQERIALHSHAIVFTRFPYTPDALKGLVAEAFIRCFGLNGNTREDRVTHGLDVRTLHREHYIAYLSKDATKTATKNVPGPGGRLYLTEIPSDEHERFGNRTFKVRADRLDALVDEYPVEARLYTTHEEREVAAERTRALNLAHFPERVLEYDGDPPDKLIASSFIASDPDVDFYLTGSEDAYLKVLGRARIRWARRRRRRYNRELVYLPEDEQLLEDWTTLTEARTRFPLAFKPYLLEEPGEPPVPGSPPPQSDTSLPSSVHPDPESDVPDIPLGNSLF